MKTFSKFLSSVAPCLVMVGLLIPAVSGCNAYRMKTPSGFAQVEADDHGAHFKGRNNVGLRVATFHNVKGGTLEFWSEDLVRKLPPSPRTASRAPASTSSTSRPETTSRCASTR